MQRLTENYSPVDLEAPSRLSLLLRPGMVDWRLWGTVILIASALVFVSLLREGYHYGVNDQAITFKVVWYWENPEQYNENDILADIAPRYYSFIWPVLGIAMRWNLAPLHWILFVGFVALKVAVLVSVFYLLRVSKMGYAAGLVAMGLLLLNHTIPGTSSAIYHSNYFSSQLVALPLTLFALALFIRGNRSLPFLVVGLTANVHLISAVHMGTVLLGALVWRNRTQLFSKATALTLSRAELAGILGAIPLAVWMSLTDGFLTQQFFVSEPWLGIVQARDAYIFPNLWPLWAQEGLAPHYIIRAAICVLILASGVFGPKTRVFRALLIGLAFLAVFGFVGSVILPMAPVIAMQFLRGMSLLWILTGILIAGYVTTRWRENTQWYVRVALVMLALSFGLSSRIGFISQALILTMLVEVFILSRRHSEQTASLLALLPISNKRIVVALGAGGGLLVLFLLYKVSVAVPQLWWIRWYVPDRNDVAELLRMLVIVGIVLATGSALRQTRLLNRIPEMWPRYPGVRISGHSLLLISGVAILVGGLIWHTNLQLGNLPGPAEAFVNPSHWQQTSLWARDNTEPGSLFLVPPSHGSFDTFSQRNTFVSRKAGALSSFNQRFAIKWTERMALMADYDSMESAELNEIAVTYGASYMVVERPEVFVRAKPIYVNERYAIYEFPLP